MEIKKLWLMAALCSGAFGSFLLGDCAPGTLCLNEGSRVPNPLAGMHPGWIFTDNSGDRWFVKETTNLMKSYIAIQLVRALVDAGLGAGTQIERALLTPRLVCGLNNGLATRELVHFKTQVQDPAAWESAQGKMFWLLVVYIVRVIDLKGPNLGTVAAYDGYLATVIDFDVSFFDRKECCFPEEIITGFQKYSIMGNPATINAFQAKNTFQAEKNDYGELRTLLKQLKKIPFSVLENSIAQSVADLRAAGYGHLLEPGPGALIDRITKRRRQLLESLHEFNIEEFLLTQESEETENL